MAFYDSGRVTAYNSKNSDKEILKFYSTKEWKKTRLLVIERDMGLCQYCLKKGKGKEGRVVHHIKPYRLYPELGLDLDNLICICKDCHAEAHPEKGYKGGVAEMLRREEKRSHFKYLPEGGFDEDDWW